METQGGGTHPVASQTPSDMEEDEEEEVDEGVLEVVEEVEVVLDVECGVVLAGRHGSDTFIER